MTCRKTYALLALVVALVGGVARSAGAQGNGSVTGTVVDERGTKLRRIVVIELNQLADEPPLRGFPLAGGGEKHLPVRIGKRREELPGGGQEIELRRDEADAHALVHIGDCSYSS